MTTKLRKPVHRESIATIRDGSKVRPVVASLLPGDVISLRPKGTRRAEFLSIATAWQYAVTLRVRKEQADKAALRKAKRRGLL